MYKRQVLYWLKRLEDSGRVPVLPVYVDSPMALGALEYYPVSYTHLRAHETVLDLVCRLLLETQKYARTNNSSDITQSKTITSRHMRRVPETR